MVSFPPWTGVNFVPTLRHHVPDTLLPVNQPLPTPYVVCITGSSRGIGVETAKAFAGAGASGLILSARTVAGLEETKTACETVARSKDLKITLIAADVGSADGVKAVIDAVRSQHGRLDLLINNAGIMATKTTAFGPFEDIPDDQLQIPLQLNTIGRLLMIKYALPFLLSSPDGAKTIVNITSLSSHFASGTPVAFNISELATNRVSESIAEMYGERGVLCYAVHPGEVKGGSFPEGFPEMFKEACQDEMGVCGAFLLWLVKERREWLNGRYLAASWDVGELEERRKEIVERDLLKMRMTV